MQKNKSRLNSLRAQLQVPKLFPDSEGLHLGPTTKCHGEDLTSQLVALGVLEDLPGVGAAQVDFLELLHAGECRKP